MLLKKKNAVLTGCNRGIGKEILEIFSKNGANVFACIRSADSNFINFTKYLEKKYKNKIYVIKNDLGNIKNLKKAADSILLKKLPIHILVNNAAIIHTALFQMTSIDKLREIFEINFFAQTIFTQYILKSMMKNKNGSIIYISSNSALDGNVGRSAYLSAKAALIAQSKVLSREVGHYNIRVNAIAPGLIKTDMMINNTTEKVINEVKNLSSLKRVGKPEEIANVVLFLASDLASHLTGQVLRVDGGV